MASPRVAASKLARWHEVTDEVEERRKREASCTNGDGSLWCNMQHEVGLNSPCTKENRPLWCSPTISGANTSPTTEMQENPPVTGGTKPERKANAVAWLPLEWQRASSLAGRRPDEVEERLIIAVGRKASLFHLIRFLVALRSKSPPSPHRGRHAAPSAAWEGMLRGPEPGRISVLPALPYCDIMAKSGRPTS